MKDGVRVSVNVSQKSEARPVVGRSLPHAGNAKKPSCDKGMENEAVGHENRGLFLMRAIGFVNSLECDEALRPIVLQYILDRLTTEELNEAERMSMASAGILEDPRSKAPAASARDPALMSVAAEAGVTYDDAASIYEMRNGGMSILAAPEILGTTEAERNRTVAILAAGFHLIAGRRALLPVSEVRRIASRCYEVKRNLAKNLAYVEGFRISGERKSKVILIQPDPFLPVFRSTIRQVLGRHDD
ncbi:hypothetical protein [Bifidobacterium miconisargentati]|uniref:hypothetical protein n=1 Tax=Bifidobacterium miconisargentati TaxID=2834437 RepID=UPI001BDBB698|nr:hypothetical protein [Bifidobacterium miconisargentati]MBW3091147.1 hypothetical protein [Bifidobacterium miconisargentati]